MGKRRALQTWVYPSQRDPHCKADAAKPTLMVIPWQWSGEPRMWMRWQELILRGRPEDPFPAWRTVDVVSWSGRNNLVSRTPGISLLQTQKSFRLCTPFSCCTHPSARLRQRAEFQAHPPPCSSWSHFPSQQPLPWRVCLPSAWTGNRATAPVLSSPLGAPWVPLRHPHEYPCAWVPLPMGKCSKTQTF